MLEWTKKVVNNNIERYRQAEDKLATIKKVEKQVADEFKSELELIANFQENMITRTAELLKEAGIDSPRKEYEDAQKEVRTGLFWPVTYLVTTHHPGVTGKTYIEDTFSVTLIEQKPKLVPNDDLSSEEAVIAHQRDVRTLVEAQMFSSLGILPNEDTIAWMRLRENNSLSSLESVVIEPQGYCKVKLHETKEE